MTFDSQMQALKRKTAWHVPGTWNESTMLCHESIHEESSGLAPTESASETDAMMKHAAALERIGII